MKKIVAVILSISLLTTTIPFITQRKSYAPSPAPVRTCTTAPTTTPAPFPSPFLTSGLRSSFTATTHEPSRPGYTMLKNTKSNDYINENNRRDIGYMYHPYRATVSGGWYGSR